VPQELLDGDSDFPMINVDIGPKGDTARFTLQAADYLAWNPDPNLNLNLPT
jgi:hypothetical protein